MALMQKSIFVRLYKTAGVEFAVVRKYLHCGTDFCREVVAIRRRTSAVVNDYLEFLFSQMLSMGLVIEGFDKDCTSIYFNYY